MLSKPTPTNVIDAYSRVRRAGVHGSLVSASVHVGPGAGGRTLAQNPAPLVDRNSPQQGWEGGWGGVSVADVQSVCV